jgi:F-type H+-transporting ATPase subunit gamma
MPNPRELDKRRKSIRNMRRITRTMELIATARFKKAMDRANAATSYTDRITQLVADLERAGLEVSHPLLETRESPQRGKLLVLTANRGFCSGFNGALIRAGVARLQELNEELSEVEVEVSGKKGISGFKFRGVEVQRKFTQFEDKPSFDEVNEIASRYLDEYLAGQIDRLDVVYTKFLSVSRQVLAVETLLPLSSLGAGEPAFAGEPASAGGQAAMLYEFLPSPESILEEVVPTSFKVKLFKCFLDSAVSEQIARMVAMKAATENAGELIKKLSMQYNRARQGRITSELMDLIGGVEALK